MLVSHRRYSILIIENAAPERAAVAQLLQSQSWEVLEAGTIAAGCHLLRERLPDLILLDSAFAPFSIGEFLKELRVSERTRFLPVVLLGGPAGPETVMRSMAMGVNDSIAKPVERSVLMAKIQAHLYYRDMTTRLDRLSELLARAGAIDPSTQVFNQRWLMDILTLEVERSALRNVPLAVAVIQVDVILPDEANSETGSRTTVVQVLARRLESTLRDSDILCRFTDEAFCALLPGVNERDAQVVAERMRYAAESKPLPVSCGGGRCALTIGVAWLPGARKSPARQLLDGARLALEDARSVGTRRISLRNMAVLPIPAEDYDRLCRTLPIEIVEFDRAERR